MNKPIYYIHNTQIYKTNKHIRVYKYKQHKEHKHYTYNNKQRIKHCKGTIKGYKGIIYVMEGIKEGKNRTV